MIRLTPYAVAGWLVAISSLTVGLFVLWRGPNRRLARVWFTFNMSLAILGFSIAWIGSTTNVHHAVIAWRLCYDLSVLWIVPLFYHFVIVFLELPFRKSVLIHYAVGFFFLPFVHTAYFLGPVYWFMNSFYSVQAGHPLFDLFLFWWMGLVIYAHILLIRSYRHVSLTKQGQIWYFLIATLIGFGFGNSGYFMQYRIQIYPWGIFAVAIYPCIMFLSMAKHRMGDIIIRTTFIYSALTAVLTSIYVAVLFLITNVLQYRVSSASVYSSAIAACAIAIVFHPLLQRIQRWVDRYFPRESLAPALLREATSGFVHEIKRPLANITIPAELALMDMDVIQKGDSNRIPMVMERLRYILDQAKEAAQKIEAIREIWSTSEPAREQIQLATWIKSILANQEKSFQKIGAMLHIAIPHGKFVILGNARQLEIVLNNLFKNAREALENVKQGQDQQLSVTLQQDGSHVVLRIKDSGPGISPENVAHLFRPYFSTKGSKGMGVGLYLAREIIQAHHGSLEVISEPGKGAEFILRLPALPSE